MMDCLEKIEKDLPLTQEVSREKMY
jgi:hypothetical protein